MCSQSQDQDLCCIQDKLEFWVEKLGALTGWSAVCHLRFSNSSQPKPVFNTNSTTPAPAVRFASWHSLIPLREIQTHPGVVQGISQSPTATLWLAYSAQDKDRLKKYCWGWQSHTDCHLNIWSYQTILPKENVWSPHCIQLLEPRGKRFKLRFKTIYCHFLIYDKLC